MSEKGSEPDIEPLGLNVAEVPKAGLRMARGLRALSGRDSTSPSLILNSAFNHAVLRCTKDFSGPGWASRGIHDEKSVSDGAYRGDWVGRDVNASKRRSRQCRGSRSLGLRHWGYRGKCNHAAGGLRSSASAASAACLLRSGGLWAATLEPRMVPLLPHDVWPIIQPEHGLLSGC